MLDHGREQPLLKMLDQFLIFLGLFHLGQTIKIGMCHQLSGQRTFGSQKQQGYFFQSSVSLDFEHAIPPVGPDKITSRQGKALKIIIQDKVGPLRILTLGKLL